MKLMIVDIGNSRIKIFYNGKYHAYSYKSDWINSIEKLSGKIKNNTQIIYSSVNDEMKNTFVDSIQEKKYNIIDAKELIIKQIKIDLTEISGAGTDRILGLFGGLKYYETPLITVDCGTAVTVNAIDENHQFLGGAIFAGLDTQIKSLAEKTSKLPEVKIDKFISNAGKNTDDAIRFGILCSVSGGIMEAINEIVNNSFLGIMPNIVISGGYAHLLLHKISSKFDKVFYKENLVIEGIEYLYNINR